RLATSRSSDLESSISRITTEPAISSNLMQRPPASKPPKSSLVMYTRYAGFAPGILILFLLQGCTAMKYVPEDRVLFTDYELKIEPRGRGRAKRSIDGLMDQNVSPRPNAEILGMRPGLWVYYVAGPATAEKK